MHNLANVAKWKISCHGDDSAAGVRQLLVRTGSYNNCSKTLQNSKTNYQAAALVAHCKQEHPKIFSRTKSDNFYGKSFTELCVVYRFFLFLGACGILQKRIDPCYLLLLLGVCECSVTGSRHDALIHTHTRATQQCNCISFFFLDHATPCPKQAAARLNNGKSQAAPRAVVVVASLYGLLCVPAS